MMTNSNPKISKLLTFRTTLCFAFCIAFLISCSSDRVSDEALSSYPNATDAKESPILTKMVTEGKLPPLEERLPKNPLIAKHDFAGYEKPGVYGGTWHRFHTDAGMGTWKMSVGVDWPGRYAGRCSHTGSRISSWPPEPPDQATGTSSHSIYCRVAIATLSSSQPWPYQV